ncbi:MAG TPA: SDR family NAD(P)-dependent oxidoreductase, partial [Duganella sp.]|nr:SDR family NAD(P)-dependent oxidoreductase [Duganella sp.]
FGAIDVLVNNAGYGLVGALEEYSDAELVSQFNTNVFGVAYVTRAVLPHMRQRRSGHIFNISSAAGVAGFAGASAYSASKFALEGMSEGLAQEVAPLGIKLTIVEPGYFRTEFLTAGSVTFAERVIDDYDATVGVARRGALEMNGKQGGDPDKLAQALLRLALAKEPPLRFSAGADSVGLLEQTLQSKAKELASWRELALSLAHDD